MALYGYKMSNFTRAKKYGEIEALLDKKLKGFEKQSYEFEKDGSVRQDYIRKNEDGSETKVTLAKNITESSIVVFSDIPLKFLKGGGWRLLVSDIVPTLIFAAIYFLMRYGMYMLYFMSAILSAKAMYISVLIAMSVIMTAINLAAARILMRKRSLARTLWIETVGIISLPVFLVELFQMLNGMLYSPLIVIIVSGALTFLILRAKGEK